MNNDTICALATPAGGAIAVIRISGPQALEILSHIYLPNSSRKSQFLANTIHYGTIQNTTGDIIDDVLVSIFRAPHSYTGEDSVEISCHGSRYIISKLLELLILNGCRQALPGEYTQRAYLNGKMDLSQAEAVADLIASTNAATHKMAMSQLRGNFSSELGILREQLLKMTSLLELELDFSDHEDLEFADRSELLELAKNIDNKIVRLSQSFEMGNAIKQGVPVAIIGKTNVGKSTLLNRLLHDDKAIVSSIHGTTRDVIEDTTIINGITFRFIDTAGIRNTTDEIELLGIERTYQKLSEAVIVLWVIDEIPDEKEIKEIIKQTAGKSLIIIQNKVDKLPIVSNSVADYKQPVLAISAKYGQGIEALEDAIFKAANIPEISENNVIITSARHYEALTLAHETFLRVIDSLENNLSGDLIAEDLRLVLSQLSEITGKGIITPNEVLGNIFKNFCIGK